MRILIIKTSSLGDVIHALPALTDASQKFPAIIFDWVVEENFVDIPRWHPQVRKVIPIALRRWREKIISYDTFTEWRKFYNELRAEEYDFIIDAQGLLKSAFIARFARGIVCGFDAHSAREAGAALFYQRKFSVAKRQHAITRVRELFSHVLGYILPATAPHYGIDKTAFVDQPTTEHYLVFLHGTTWTTKHWPEEYWVELAKLTQQKGFLVKLPWGNRREHERAQRIAMSCAGVEVLPQLGLREIAHLLAGAKGVVAVDTGLGHLAAALDVPTVSLYGPTHPALTGTLGQSQAHLAAKFPCAPCLGRECTYQGRSSPISELTLPVYSKQFYPPSPLKPPCFTTLFPAAVWEALETVL